MQWVTLLGSSGIPSSKPSVILSFSTFPLRASPLLDLHPSYFLALPFCWQPALYEVGGRNTLSIATSLSKVPPSVMSALLREQHPIAPACPFGFLLQSKEPASGSSEERDPKHQAWLEQAGWLNGEGKLQAGWRQTLRILAQPCQRLTLTEQSPEKVRRRLFVSDGYKLVFAMFDRQHCWVSEPVTYAAMLEQLVRSVGVPDPDQKTHPPLQTTPDVLRILGALAEGGLTLSPSQRDRKANARPVLGLSEQRAEEILGDVLQDPVMGSALLVDMIYDQIVLSDQVKIWVHPNFSVWHSAIVSGATFHLLREDLPEGNPTVEDKSQQKGVFLGGASTRCLMWPSPSDPHSILLARADRTTLQSILLFLIGAPDSDDSLLQDTLQRSGRKFSFRG